MTGESIPIEVQILSITDVYEAPRKTRLFRHRNGLFHIETIEEMNKMRGKRWEANLLFIYCNFRELGVIRVYQVLHVVKR